MAQIQLTYRQQADMRIAAMVRNPDAIIMVGRDGTILDVNEQAEMLTGISYRNLVGQPLTALVPAGSRAGHDDLMAGFFESPGRRVMGHDRDVAIVQRTRDGELVIPVRIHLAAAAIEDLGLVAVATIHQLAHHWSATSEEKR